ncbi:MAG: glycosyltransferase family 8 protein [Oscillospiraceae bacterium]|jgi:lipopolysaccharide biosynthesis glycosyltransferase
MNILVTIDGNYVRQLCVMLKSLRCSNQDEALKLYILHRSLIPEDIGRISSLLDGDGIEIFPVPITEPEVEDAPTSARYPIEIYDRIYAGRYLPVDLKRVLYLDPDTIILRDLSELWTMDLGDSWFAAASHVREFGKAVNSIRLTSDLEGPYINTGVMLMDLQKMRENIDPSDVQRFINTHRYRMNLPDQDILSALYGSHIFALDPFIYNMTERMLAPGKEQMAFRRSLDWVDSNTRIIHYVGRNKPWKPGYVGRLGVYYRKYSAMLLD